MLSIGVSNYNRRCRSERLVEGQNSNMTKTRGQSPRHNDIPIAINRVCIGPLGDKNGRSRMPTTGLYLLIIRKDSNGFL